MKKTIFDQLTNQYALVKTLRFELRPVKKTAEILETERRDKENFKKDRKIAENYKKLKELLDELHQEFIQDVMSDFKFSEDELKKFEDAYLRFLNSSNDDYKEKQTLKDAYEKIGKELAAKISKAFNKYDRQKYGLTFTKKNLLSEKVFNYLEEKYKDDSDNLKVIRTFKYKPTKEEKKQGKKLVAFTTYLTGFNQNRENFYKDEMKASQFATRTIENLIQFIKNRKLFKDKYQDKYSKLGFTDEQIKIFNLSYFNNLFLQKGIDKYNGILGGVKGEINTTNEGLNQKINLYKQKEKTRIKQEGGKFNKADYPVFKELYKQIGSIKSKSDAFIEITNDDELVKELNQFPDKVAPVLEEIKKFYDSFFVKLQNNEYNLAQIYLPKSIGTYFSQLAFSDWSKLAYVYNKKWRNENVKLEEGQEVNVQYRSLADIKERFKELEKDGEKFIFSRTYKKDLQLEDEITDAEQAWETFWQIIEHHIKSQYQGGQRIIFDREKEESITENFGGIDDLKNKYLEAVKKYDAKMNQSDEGLTDDEEKEIKAALKDYLDRVKEIERIGRYFDLRKYFDDIDEANKDSDFYFYYQLLLDNIAATQINDYYNAFRNYLTQVNVTDEKIKLNFDDGQTLSGWDLNKETEKFGVIFRKKTDFGYKYYLGIINKNENRNILNKKVHPEIFVDNSEFKKMEYKLFPSPSKMLPKIGFTKYDNGERNKPIFLDGDKAKEIAAIKKEFAEFQEEKKNDRDKWSNEFGKKKLIKLIDYYKLVLEKHPENYIKTFNFSFKESYEYRNLGEFNDDVAKQNYAIKFVGIDKNYIDKKVASGELYLFEIHNKDWNTLKDGSQKTSNKNLHTLYFEELFSDENLKEPVFKLSGGAEVFFRDAIEKKKWKKKKDKNGKEVLDKPRFTKNKILFHVPIEINYGKGSINQAQFNQKINQFLSKNKQDIKILGIDRGEKHLLYYSLIDLNGKIIESGSLNKIKIGNKEVDFYQKLDEAEKERQKARKSWQKINKIKNLKAGYISHVIKKIVDLAIENNAIIVLEDLNFGFKSARQKIEKNVYQQFEKALVDKLGFVVDKEKQNQRQAPQLSAPFKSFDEIKKFKQTGIIYYVLAANTSKVCPACQWRKRIYPQYAGKDTIEKLQKNYKLSMHWLDNENRFVFSYKDEDKQEVMVYSDVDRIRYDKKLNNNQGGYRIYSNDSTEERKEGRNVIERSITLQLKDLLQNEFGIKDFSGDLIKKMTKKTQELSADAIKNFLYLFNLILNIRNSMTDTAEDYIQCPACGFDTRKDNKLGIKNGDDNGAYNIALRGLYLLKKKDGIFSCIDENEKYKKPKLTFKNTEYFQWAKDYFEAI